MLQSVPSTELAEYVFEENVEPQSISQVSFCPLTTVCWQNKTAILCAAFAKHKQKVTLGQPPEYTVVLIAPCVLLAGTAGCSKRDC